MFDFSKFKELGYEYFGQLHKDQPRHYARKRGKINFNLAIVPYPSDALE